MQSLKDLPDHDRFEERDSEIKDGVLDFIYNASKLFKVSEAHVVLLMEEVINAHYRRRRKHETNL